MIATLVPLQAATFGLVAVGAGAVALCRNPLRQILFSGLYGLLLTILFTILQAPDVALSMLVVSSTAYPLIVLVSIGRTRAGNAQQEES